MDGIKSFCITRNYQEIPYRLIEKSLPAVLRQGTNNQNLQKTTKMNTKETKLTTKGLMERKDSSPNKKHKWPKK